ncbi:MAG: cysteine hydrolase [Thaumarchaeota archaeon]|nr:cysteine hydrolase [Nitrososphaerota archaeon]
MKFEEKLNIHRYEIGKDDGIAIVVIDMQNDFVHQKGAFAATGAPTFAGPIIPNIKRLLETARSLRIPIVYTRQVSRPDLFDAVQTRSIQSKACVQGTWGVEIADDLKPTQQDFLIDAPRRNRFYDSRLELILRKLKVTTLIFTGFASDGCVESTARDAEVRDYKIIVLSDCTASTDPLRHEAALISMTRVAMITTLDRILEAISVKAVA